MPFVLSYGWDRNPPRLLKKFGFGGRLKSKSEEDSFLALVSQSPCLLHGVCLVMGGFMDGILGKAYAVLGLLPEILRTNFDIYYREHDEDEAARSLILSYGRAHRSVIAIGHSWGGSTLALDVLGSAFVRQIPIAVLLTLDPVGVRSPVPLPNVRRWLNIYIDYGKADWRRQNIIARMGSPWGSVPYASENRVFSGSNHADASGMVREHGIPLLTVRQ